MSKGLAQTFLQEEIQTAPKHMERSSVSLLIREMQMKTESLFQGCYI